MQARDVYELREERPSRQGRWWRRLGQLVVFIVLQGEPMSGGGWKVSVVEKQTGRVVGVLEQNFGERNWDTQLREDLRDLSATDFQAKWEWLDDAS